MQVNDLPNFSKAEFLMTYYRFFCHFLVSAMLTPTNSFLLLGFLLLCQFWYKTD